MPKRKSTRNRSRPAELPGLGPVSEAWLAAAGITTTDQLRQVGVVEAFGRVRFNVGRAATRNLLYALQAALHGVHWTAIGMAEKRRLCRAAGIAPPGVKVARRSPGPARS